MPPLAWLFYNISSLGILSKRLAKARKYLIKKNTKWILIFAVWISFMIAGYNVHAAKESRKINWIINITVIIL